MRHTFRAATLVVVALVLSFAYAGPASADSLGAVNRALAAVGQAAVTDADADGVVTAGNVSLSGEGESVARTTQDGAQVITVLREGSTARYDFDLPDGAQLVEAADGIGIVQAGSAAVVLGVVHAPWAVDANGKRLPTAYSVDGSTLVQTVDTSRAAYPVVADPQISTGLDWPYGPIWKVKFSKGDVNTIIEGHYNWAAVSIVGFACAAIGAVNWQAGVACGAIGAFYADSIANAFRRAYDRNPNNCVYMKFTYSGIPLEWYRYNCDGSTY
jgi:hypothetical protein